MRFVIALVSPRPLRDGGHDAEAENDPDDVHRWVPSWMMLVTNCTPRKLLAAKSYAWPSSAAIDRTCRLSTRRMIVPVIKRYLRRESDRRERAATDDPSTYGMNCSLFARRAFSAAARASSRSFFCRSISRRGASSSSRRKLSDAPVRARLATAASV